MRCSLPAFSQGSGEGYACPLCTATNTGPSYTKDALQRVVVDQLWLTHTVDTPLPTRTILHESSQTEQSTATLLLL